jgi:hypothetical protein
MQQDYKVDLAAPDQYPTPETALAGYRNGVASRTGVDAEADLEALIAAEGSTPRVKDVLELSMLLLVQETSRSENKVVYEAFDSLNAPVARVEVTRQDGLPWLVTLAAYQPPASLCLAADANAVVPPENVEEFQLPLEDPTTAPTGDGS